MLPLLTAPFRLFPTLQVPLSDLVHLENGKLHPAQFLPDLSRMTTVGFSLLGSPRQSHDRRSQVEAYKNPGTPFGIEGNFHMDFGPIRAVYQVRAYLFFCSATHERYRLKKADSIPRPWHLMTDCIRSARTSRTLSSLQRTGSLLLSPTSKPKSPLQPLSLPSHIPPSRTPTTATPSNLPSSEAPTLHTTISRAYMPRRSSRIRATWVATHRPRACGARRTTTS